MGSNTCKSRDDEMVEPPSPPNRLARWFRRSVLRLAPPAAALEWRVDGGLLDRQAAGMVFAQLTRYQGRHLPLVNRLSRDIVAEDGFKWRASQYILAWGGKSTTQPVTASLDRADRLGQVTYCDTFQILNPNGVALSEHPIVPSERRSGAAGAVWKDRVYIMGGTFPGTGRQAHRGSGYNSVRSAATDVFDLRTQQWSVGPAMVHATARPAAAVLKGLIYLIGGYTAETVGADGYLSTVFTLDPRDPDGQWQEAPSMAQCRTLCCAAAVAGRLYVFGGYSGTEYLDVCEMYNPQTEQWAAIPAMPAFKSSAAIGVSKDKVIIAGGFSGTEHTNSVFSFCTSTLTWSTIAPMRYPRTGRPSHTPAG